eukprot:3853295-Rhodomonas_salina.2
MEIDSNLKALLEHVCKKQKVLSVLEKAGNDKNQTPWQGRGGSCTREKGAYCGSRQGARGGHCGAPGSPKGGCQPEENCYQCDVASESKKLDKLEERQSAAVARSQDKEEQRQHHRAQYVGNKTDDKYTVSFTSWDPTQIIDPLLYTTICLNVKQSKQYLEGAAVDSASPIDIQNNGKLARLTCTPNVFLEGITPGTMEGPAAECTFLMINTYGQPVVLRTKGKGILHAKATLKVISLWGLLHSGCKANFKVGLPGDHQFGGVIEHPTSTTVNMIYMKGIWRLPVLTKEKAAALHHGTYIASINSTDSDLPADHQYRVLLDLVMTVGPA